MPGRVTTREDDELLLQMLRWRDEGFSNGQIGRHLGIPDNRVRTMTNRVYAEMENERS